MIYLETDKTFSNSISAELKAAGLPAAFGMTTRRIIDGKVQKGHSRALTIDVDESQRSTVQSVLDAHVPFFDHADKKIAEVKAEARRRIDAIAPLWKQMNAARENPSDAIFSEIDVIRKKSNMIEAHLATLTDAEAGAYDIENSPFWD
jgi:hypothetical protein